MLIKGKVQSIRRVTVLSVSILKLIRGISMLNLSDSGRNLNKIIKKIEDSSADS